MSKRRFTSVGVRQIVTHGIVATTTLAAVTSVVAPGIAVAAPSSAVADAGSIGTNDEQRVAAAAVVRLEPTPDVLLLSDYDFIHALWQKARDAGETLDSVRTAAEAVMAGSSSEEHVRFITTGIHQAYELDKQREKDRADADRAARQARLQALLAVGIPSTPELLALNDENFILAFAEHANAGPEVRAAARRALAGDQATRREFIVNGAREAHTRDVANKLKELEEKDRAEAERRRELAARKNAADLFGIVLTEAMLGLSDDNFIRELLRNASEGVRKTEIYAEGQRTLLSLDPAKWKHFIQAGAEQAYKRDDEARRKRIADANRRLALQVQAAAEKTGINPGLAAAAREALAGTDDDVTRFLKEDNQYRARRQSFKMFFGSFYLRQSRPDGRMAYTGPLDDKSKQADREDATWVVVPSLANEPGCHSFESPREPGYYLTIQQNLRVGVSADDGTADFRKRATWCTRKELGFSFESASRRNHWLTVQRGAVYAKQGISDQYFDAHWEVASPLAR
ncbi:AbfB domain-containing protein [Streptomyces olivoreticuli]|uniref:AbfB domain-containing protein n=1 Tax=Streptomyces olivoreticuli TaxID=68246 RepID=UPI00265A4198|nr:AbfB domain-containing protein [Streptomyces olivoreticuli]WKK22257.1 AbfB domain-containing protein [Streptomyces olivoreticuli]